ncbi:MAG: TIGR03943 family protein [Thermoflexales bacterium]|nr:TIGR03943 family protein [Thermoflexales bacterium]MDW8351387.1 TIGR03943 family protein [Anaerolineae bacterium]
MGSPRVEYLLKAVVLAASGLMFYAKISDGTLAFYINQRFAWLSLVAVIIYLALAITMVYKAGQHRQFTRSLSELDEFDVIPLQARDPRRRSGHRASWLALGLLVLPALLGLFTPARPLGASAIESRGIGLTAPDRAGTVTQAQRIATGPKNILDWLREFSRAADLSTFEGQAADVIGFVYKDPRTKPDEFWVSRFVVSCCVADATALGLLVQTEDAPTLPADRWVRVVGKFRMGEFAGERIPVIVAERVEPTQQPAQPYLYP